MINLSDRQLQLLKSIIEEYIETADAVGSETLDKKYNLGVSPATIRNEMVRLTQIGYLKQPHTSAGRVPTPKAMRLYVDRLMKEKELSVVDEVNVKQKIWDYRSEMDKLLREATKGLAKHTHMMSMSTTDEGDMYISGVGNILEMPEFFDIDITRTLLDSLDEYEYWWEIAAIRSNGNRVTILLGDDLRRKMLYQCGGVFTHFESPSHQGMIGVIGPARMNYPRVIPHVKYIGDLISDIARQW